MLLISSSHEKRTAKKLRASRDKEFKGGDSQQLYFHDCSGTTFQVTPQGRHRKGSNWLSTNGIQFYVIANLDKTFLGRRFAAALQKSMCLSLVLPARPCPTLAVTDSCAGFEIQSISRTRNSFGQCLEFAFVHSGTLPAGDSVTVLFAFFLFSVQQYTAKMLVYDDDSGGTAAGN